MRTHVALAWLIAAFPALAQELPGIDLSKPPSEQERKGEGNEQPPVDLTQPPPPTRPPAEAPAEKKAEPAAPFRVDDVALGDKVKAVQRKGFMKRGRFELTPLFAVQLNDAFYQKLGGGLRAAYYFEDSFGLALRGLKFEPVRTDNVRTGKIAFGSQLLPSQLYEQYMLDAVWSPIYGKSSFRGKSILHFDLSLQAGFGLVTTDTTHSPRNEGVDLGVVRGHVAADVGGALRFYPRSWLAVELGVTGTFYPDQPIESVPGNIQKVLAATLGFSFFLPTGFDYVYP
jgi:outer membrane beta-barrel protein